MSTGPRIALIGDGRMARAVAACAAERGWSVVASIGAKENVGGRAITRASLADAEVAIEFTEPTAAVPNVEACLRAGCPVVVGTTGWYDALPAVTAEVDRAGGAMLWAANFSLGVNMMAVLATTLARMVARVGGFDLHMVETHHVAKKDAPSGTAIVLRQAVRDGGADLPITSVRVGAVPGTHTIVCDGAFEQLELTHLARDRRVFAEGALTAAAWLVGRCGVFTMRDVLDLDPSSHG